MSEGLSVHCQTSCSSSLSPAVLYDAPSLVRPPQVLRAKQSNDCGRMSLLWGAAIKSGWEATQGLYALKQNTTHYGRRQANLSRMFILTPLLVHFYSPLLHSTQFYSISYAVLPNPVNARIHSPCHHSTIRNLLCSTDMAVKEHGQPLEPPHLLPESNPPPPPPPHVPVQAPVQAPAGSPP